MYKLADLFTIVFVGLHSMSYPPIIWVHVHHQAWNSILMMYSVTLLLLVKMFANLFSFCQLPNNCNHQFVLQELSRSVLFFTELLQQVGLHFLWCRSARRQAYKLLNGVFMHVKRVLQFKNPICSCWTSFSLFLSSRGLQSDFLKSTDCYILTDGSHIGLYRMWKAPRWITTLSDFTESLLQT